MWGEGGPQALEPRGEDPHARSGTTSWRLHSPRGRGEARKGLGLPYDGEEAASSWMVAVDASMTPIDATMTPETPQQKAIIVINRVFQGCQVSGGDFGQILLKNRPIFGIFGQMLILGV